MFIKGSHLTEWPSHIPDDLENAFAEFESFRFTVQSQDRWTVIREWLEKHEVPAPAELPQTAETKFGD